MSNYEEQIISVLKKSQLKFVREKTFSDLHGGKYRYDFFVPSQNILIEVDGQYHFFPISGRAALKSQQERDRRKNAYALAHNIPLYRIPYWAIDTNQIQTYENLTDKSYLVTSKWHNDRIFTPKTYK